MSGNAKLAAVGRTRAKKRNLDIPIAGRGGYLAAGEHEVTLREVDLSGFEQSNYIDFKFEGITGSLHNQRVWTLKFNSDDEYHPAFVALVNALFCDPSIYEVIDELVADQNLQEGTFAAFKGMKLKVSIDYSDGYRTVLDEGKYIIVDAKTKQQLDARRFDSVNDARQAAVVQRWKRSWPAIKRYEALDDEVLTYNRELFNNAISGMRQAKETVSSPRQIFNPAAFRAVTKGR
jgi:hypothetical protein